MPRLLFPLAALAALALPASAQGAAPPDRDGIHVVGAWTLTVLDPDGSVVERREFHNDLTDTGARILGSMLSGGMVEGRWEIRVLYGSNEDYTVGEPGSLSEFDNLIVSDFYSEPVAGVRLSGSFTADVDGAIESVRTRLLGCSANVSPDDCGAQGPLTLGGRFTWRDFEPESRLSFVSGQTVQVQVDISFDFSDFAN